MSANGYSEVQPARYREVRKVTLIGSVVDLPLGVIKILVGWLAHSQALVADGVHSLSDLATDFLVLYAAKHSHATRTKSIPTATAASRRWPGLGWDYLILVALGIGFDAVQRMFDPELLLEPGAVTLADRVHLGVLQGSDLPVYGAMRPGGCARTC